MCVVAVAFGFVVGDNVDGGDRVLFIFSFCSDVITLSRAASALVVHGEGC